MMSVFYLTFSFITYFICLLLTSFLIVTTFKNFLSGDNCVLNALPSYLLLLYKYYPTAIFLHMSFGYAL